MKKLLLGSVVLLCWTLVSCQSSSKNGRSPHPYASAGSSQQIPTPSPSETFITNSRQITFAGKRSGEGYFSKNGDQMIFQSERQNGNPFYQIYLKNLNTGKTHRVSPGQGKTTCAWIHPTQNKVLFSSTHHDPRIKAKQKEELKIRASGKNQRYSWSYDDQYDIYVSDKKGRKLQNLTKTLGYDAEASFSPNGKWIAFASNRNGYSQKLSAEDQKAFKQNQSYMMDIYIMKSDGSQVRQLTQHKGYDGGPFFSPDGKRIVWRRFSKDGHTAEIYTMNIDGSDKKQLTNSKAMSWAPYYHPSGDYIIYTTSIHGHHNFELYAIDTRGLKKPVRVSYSPGFDGLPVFTPDGLKITWSKKLANNQSQIFMANWNDELIRQKLELPRRPLQFNELSPEIQTTDIKKIIKYLASEKLKGRKTGSPEEKMYMSRLAEIFKKMGLKPAGQHGTYTQEFEFLSELKLGQHNHIEIKGINFKTPLTLGKDWTPLAFTKTGSQKHMPISFVGYGITAPGTEDIRPYDSYKGVNIEGHWAMMFRYVPEGLSDKRRQHLLRYSSLHSKIMAAKVRGAKGIIFVSGPNSNVNSQLVKFRRNSVHASSAVSVISINDDLAQKMLGHKNLGEIQTNLDAGNFVQGFKLPKLALASHLSIDHKMGKANNLLALLPVKGAQKTIIIGAHGDHLGQGHSDDSLMNNKSSSNIHYGADDNASGVAGVIELAHYFSNNLKSGKTQLKQNILFAIWSGEEVGILGSNHFTKFDSKTNKLRNGKFSKRFSTYINMDMIGRLSKSLAVQGVGSSQEWDHLIERLSLKHSIPMITQKDPYLPTDAMAFYMTGIPVLSFFTGVHSDYHSPTDIPEKINWKGTLRTINIVKDFSSHVISKRLGPKYHRVDQKHNTKSKGRQFRISLGTIPDYSTNKGKGVLLSGVTKGGAAEKAGLMGGDTIIKFASFKIDNIYDYVYSLQSIKPNVKTTIVVIRQGNETELEIIPVSKD